MRKMVLFSLVSAAMLFAANGTASVEVTTDSALLSNTAVFVTKTDSSVVDSAAVVDVTATKADSAVAVLADSAKSVEQALLAEPISEEELIRRGRAKLLMALTEGDRDAVLQTIAFLDKKYSDKLCPFTLAEKGIAYLQVGVYDSAMTELIKSRRLSELEPKSVSTMEERCIVAYTTDRSKVIRDELFEAHLNLMDSFRSDAKEDSLVALIQKASVDPFYKDAAPAFLPVVFYRNSEFVSAASLKKHYESGMAFVQKYPMNENSVWLEKKFLKYYRDWMANLEAAKQPKKKAVSSEEVIQKHLYSVGAGLEFLTGLGFLTGELKDEFHHKYWDFYMAIPIQIHHVVLTPFVSFGAAETRDDRQFSHVLWEKNSEILLYESGIALGLVAFDSRYVKLEPFVGIAITSAALPEGSDDYYYYANKTNNNYHLLREEVKTNNSVAYLAGLTGEFRLLTIYNSEDWPLKSISLRIKYMANYIDHDFGYKKMDGFSHKLLAGVGFFIW